MTTLVLGVAGGIVGNMLLPGIGGSIGFLVGSLLGNLIDPPKIEGPRRTDLKLQRSEYGTMFPFVWGTGRIAGNVIDQTDLEEHKETSGGKGGPEVTTYTYSASFLVALAAAKRFGDPAIAGVLRIWADGRLIWDSTSGEDMPCTLYLGTEDQEPDPTFEAINGVGNQPAYRGLAYASFADYMLTDFGDRIPVLEFEVFTEAGTFPWRVSTWDTTSPDGFLMGSRSAEFSSGEITIGWWDDAPGSNTYYTQQFDLYGNELSGLTGTTTDTLVEYSAKRVLVGSDGSTWYQGGNVGTTITANPTGGSLAFSVWNPTYSNGYLYAISYNTVSGDIWLTRWPCPDGQVTDVTATSDANWDIAGNTGVSSNSSLVLGTSNNGKVYLTDSHTIPTSFYLYEFDADLVLVRQWDLIDRYNDSPIVNAGRFVVYQSPTSGRLVFACDRGTAGNKQVGAFYLNDDLSVEFVGAVDAENGNNQMLELGNSPYVLVSDGVVSLEPPADPALLSTIVADLSSMTSLSGYGSPETDCYDVSELTDEVRWYAVGTQSTVRNAIDPLRRGFFFDAVESDDLVKFRKRGATDSVVTIDDDDLVAREYGADSGDPLITTRKREQGMPRTVTLKYIDVDMDYQTGAQNSPRLTTLSDSDVTLDLPIGFTANEALQKCWSLQVAEWIERESFEWTTTRKYAWVEPCDVVTVRGRVVRVTNRQESPKGVITWTGVLHRPSIYTQDQVAGSSEGFVEQTSPAAPVPTQAVLLDIPILSQVDSPFGFYAAMGPARDGRWTGATLYKSLDDGSTYTAVASTVSPAVIGRTASTDILGSPAYGSPTVTGVLPTASGDTIEEVSVCVVLTDDDAELVSTTSNAMSHGANLCAISLGVSGSPATTQWELLQFRDATLVAPKTYILSGFLRGRKDTSTSGHADGDTFVLLPTVNVDAPQSELGVTLKYKAVTFGRALADAAVITFTNTGLSALEYYEVEAGELPWYGSNPTGSPAVPNPGLVPPPAGACDSTYFLNQCGDWAVPAGSSSDAWLGQVRWLCANPGSSAMSQIGCAFAAAGGTTTAGTLASTNMLTGLARFICTSTASTGVATGINDTTGDYWRGNATDLGGFRTRFLFGFVTTRSAMRVAIGLGASTLVAGATDPSTSNTDCVFVGADAADTNLQIMHNDGSGNCTKVDTGIPKATDNMVVEVIIYCGANSGTITVEVNRLDSAASFSSDLTTNLPTSTVFMFPVFRFGTGTQSSSVVGAVMEFRGLVHRLSQ